MGGDCTMQAAPVYYDLPGGTTMKKMTLFAAALAVVGVSACDKSKPELEKTLVQVQQISAEKDSLLKDVMQTSQFIADVNTQLATVKSRNAGKPTVGKPGEMENNLTPAQQREAIKVKVKELTDRLNESESRLNASRKRVADLAGNNSAMTKQLAAYDSTISAFKSIIENQKAEIATLAEQVAALTGENTALKAEKTQLTAEKTTLVEEKSTLTTERNTVYYVIGTEDELFKKKIITKSGGVIGLGKTALPNSDLNPADFTSIDKTKVSEIAFPRADKAYKVVSRQDVGGLEVQPDKSGRIKGGLKITNAEKFWAGSKFLILMEQ
jgi:outer membrane murein-binding lipoprotein Lpp/regulator of replication initiation timing